jgi:predicted lipoprotein
MRRTWLISLVAVVVGVILCFLIWPLAFTVVSVEKVQQEIKSEAFDPVVYVDKIWDSKIVPTINEKAVDLSLILGEMKLDSNGFAKKEDLSTIAQKYGLITVGEAHVYMVKGMGQVVNVDTQSTTGIMEIQLDGYTGPVKVLIYIGPRIPSDETSVRDAVGFINFGDFREQTEYGKVGAEINKRIIAQVLAPLNIGQLQGKNISFFGAMTIRTFNLINIDLKRVTIVPIKIEVKE